MASAAGSSAIQGDGPVWPGHHLALLLTAEDGRAWRLFGVIRDQWTI